MLRLQNMEMRSFDEGEYIVRKGEPGRSMMFISKGVVRVRIVLVLWHGEYACLLSDGVDALLSLILPTALICLSLSLAAIDRRR